LYFFLERKVPKIHPDSSGTAFADPLRLKG